jgi:ABC-2 type transport system ATP-binding protein
MIIADGLTKQFGDFTAVADVSFTVRAGEVVALLGPNGAGKTTTVRMLTSILRPSSGRASIAGWDVCEQPAMVRRNVGVLTEQHGLYDRMTAREYLQFFAGLYRVPDDVAASRIAHLLEYFGLAKAADRNTETFSKGMRQKLALARALLHDPPALLLDEPTSAMDPESAQLVRQEIARLRSAERAILLCTHNLIEAEMLADRILIIRDGRIIQNGTAEELRRRLLGAPVFELRLAFDWSPPSWPPDVEVLEVAPRRVRMRIAHPDIVNPSLVHWLAEHGAPVRAFQEVPRPLEEVYLAAMRQAGERDA